MARKEIVSSDNENLILVDELDREIGAKSKIECHQGTGVLHRAFSVFVFNDAGELYLQKRSSRKPLWPNYWSNTCCSHPRVGETMEQAVSRRLVQELGFDCPVQFLYKFKYQAQYDAEGAEHEYCWVYYGRYDGKVDVNVSEVADWRAIKIEELESELKEAPDMFTPWFKMEWRQIRQEYLDRILNGVPVVG